MRCLSPFFLPLGSSLSSPFPLSLPLTSSFFPYHSPPPKTSESDLHHSQQMRSTNVFIHVSRSSALRLPHTHLLFPSLPLQLPLHHHPPHSPLALLSFLSTSMSLLSKPSLIPLMRSSRLSSPSDACVGRLFHLTHKELNKLERMNVDLSHPPKPPSTPSFPSNPASPASRASYSSSPAPPSPHLTMSRRTTKVVIGYLLLHVKQHLQGRENYFFVVSNLLLPRNVSSS